MQPSEHTSGVIDHKRLVGTLLQSVISDLVRRAVEHDDSKFSAEEYPLFEEMTPILKTLTYGSEAYHGALAKMQPAITHHYAMNSHHPEHYPDGINDMDLLDLIEMVCDWIAATRRVKDGDIFASLPINQQRFGISDQLYRIICNTVLRLTAHP